MSTRSILITGGTSILGAHLVAHLAHSAEVLTLGRKGCDITCDLSPAGSAVSIPHVDAVVHTAAQFGGPSDLDFYDAFAVNVLGTLRVCQMAAAARVAHLTIISSAHAALPSSDLQYGIYTLSKRQAEETARLYCLQRALPLAILRPSRLYGDDDRFRKHQPFLYTIVDKAEAGEDIVIFGSHDPWRNYIHIDDLCRTIAGVVASGITGTFSCMYPSDVTYSEIARTAMAAFQRRGVVRFAPERADIPDNVLPADNSLYEKLGVHPMVSIAEGMARIAAHRRSCRS